MKYPDLVPDWVCTTPISLVIEGEGLTEDGEPIEIAIGDQSSGDEPQPSLMCNWQDGGKTVYTEEQKIIDISGRAYFNGDIVPTISNITGGYATIFDEVREIAQGFKRRNPDGTVNHTEIQFK